MKVKVEVDIEDRNYQRAAKLVGVSDPQELVTTLINKFVLTNASQTLVKMGGSDPSAVAAPRRRFGTNKV